VDEAGFARLGTGIFLVGFMLLIVAHVLEWGLPIFTLGVMLAFLGFIYVARKRDLVHPRKMETLDWVGLGLIIAGGLLGFGAFLLQWGAVFELVGQVVVLVGLVVMNHRRWPSRA